MNQRASGGVPDAIHDRILRVPQSAPHEGTPDHRRKASQPGSLPHASNVQQPGCADTVLRPTTSSQYRLGPHVMNSTMQQQNAHHHGIMPQQNMPQQGFVPQQSRLHQHAMPQHGILPQQALPQYGILPQHAMPQHGALPQQAIPQQGMLPQHGMVPQQTMPQYGGLPQQALPHYGILPHHGVPQQIPPQHGGLSQQDVYAGRHQPRQGVPASDTHHTVMHVDLPASESHQEAEARLQSPHKDVRQSDSREFSIADFQALVETLKPEEETYFQMLWNASGRTGDRLAGQEAFSFLSRSNLSRDQLKRIWELSDVGLMHSLGYVEFVIALKLIYAAQLRQALTLQRILTVIPNKPEFPQIEGVPVPGKEVPSPESVAPVPAPLAKPMPQTIIPSEVQPTEPVSSTEMMANAFKKFSTFGTSHAPDKAEAAPPMLPAETKDDDDEWGAFLPAPPVPAPPRMVNKDKWACMSAFDEPISPREAEPASSSDALPSHSANPSHGAPPLSAVPQVDALPRHSAVPPHRASPPTVTPSVTPLMSPREEDVQKGSIVWRKGRRAKIVKIDRTMDPPSITVVMEDTGQEVGTELEYVSLHPPSAATDDVQTGAKPIAEAECGNGVNPTHHTQIAGSADHWKDNFLSTSGPHSGKLLVDCSNGAVTEGGALPSDFSLTHMDDPFAPAVRSASSAGPPLGVENDDPFAVPDDWRSDFASAAPQVSPSAPPPALELKNDDPFAVPDDWRGDFASAAPRESRNAPPPALELKNDERFAAADDWRDDVVSAVQAVSRSGPSPALGVKIDDPFAAADGWKDHFTSAIPEVLPIAPQPPSKPENNDPYAAADDWRSDVASEAPAVSSSVPPPPPKAKSDDPFAAADDWRDDFTGAIPAVSLSAPPPPPKAKSDDPYAAADDWGDDFTGAKHAVSSSIPPPPLTAQNDDLFAVAGDWGDDFTSAIPAVSSSAPLPHFKAQNDDPFAVAGDWGDDFTSATRAVSSSASLPPPKVKSDDPFAAADNWGDDFTSATHAVSSSAPQPSLKALNDDPFAVAGDWGDDFTSATRAVSSSASLPPPKVKSDDPFAAADNWGDDFTSAPHAVSSSAPQPSPTALNDDPFAAAGDWGDAFTGAPHTVLSSTPLPPPRAKSDDPFAAADDWGDDFRSAIPAVPSSAPPFPNETKKDDPFGTADDWRGDFASAVPAALSTAPPPHLAPKSAHTFASTDDWGDGSASTMSAMAPSVPHPPSPKATFDDPFAVAGDWENGVESTTPAVSSTAPPPPPPPPSSATAKNDGTFSATEDRGSDFASLSQHGAINTPSQPQAPDDPLAAAGAFPSSNFPQATGTIDHGAGFSVTTQAADPFGAADGDDWGTDFAAAPALAGASSAPPSPSQAKNDDPSADANDWEAGFTNAQPALSSCHGGPQAALHASMPSRPARQGSVLSAHKSEDKRATDVAAASLRATAAAAADFGDDPFGDIAPRETTSTLPLADFFGTSLSKEVRATAKTQSASSTLGESRHAIWEGAVRAPEESPRIAGVLAEDRDDGPCVVANAGTSRGLLHAESEGFGASNLDPVPTSRSTTSGGLSQIRNGQSAMATDMNALSDCFAPEVVMHRTWSGACGIGMPRKSGRSSHVGTSEAAWTDLVFKHLQSHGYYIEAMEVQKYIDQREVINSVEKESREAASRCDYEEVARCTKRKEQLETKLQSGESQFPFWESIMEGEPNGTCAERLDALRERLVALNLSKRKENSERLPNTFDQTFNVTGKSLDECCTAQKEAHFFVYVLHALDTTPSTLDRHVALFQAMRDLCDTIVEGLTRVKIIPQEESWANWLRGAEELWHLAARFRKGSAILEMVDQKNAIVVARDSALASLQILGEVLKRYGVKARDWDVTTYSSTSGSPCALCFVHARYQLGDTVLAGNESEVPERDKAVLWEAKVYHAQCLNFWLEWGRMQPLERKLDF